MTGYTFPIDLEEPRILDSYRSQSRAALELLYRRYAPALRQFCRGRLHDSAEAEDACHDTILKAYRALPRFHTGARIWPWLATIAANICLDVQRNRRAVSLDDKPDQPIPEPDLAKHSRVQLVGEALRNLPDRQRTYVYLQEYEGWSYEQIAQFFSVSVTSVRSSLFRARKELKRNIRKIAEQRGQWPLPALIPATWLRALSAAESWRISLRNAWTDIWMQWNLASIMANLTALAVVVAGISGGSATVSSPMVLRSPAPLSNISSGSGAMVSGASELGPVRPKLAGISGAQSTPAGIRDETRPHYESPSVRASTDLGNDNSSKVDAGSPSIGYDCGPPEERGYALGLACPILEQLP